MQAQSIAVPPGDDTAPDRSSLVNVSQVADLAGVGLSAVSNWRKRFDDFPRPAEGVPGGRDLFDLGEVEAWLRKRGRLKRDDRSKELLFSAANLLRGHLSAASMIEVLGAALAMVAMGRRQSLSASPSAGLRTALWESIAARPELEDIFEPMQAVDKATLAQVLDLVAEIDDLTGSFEWLLTLHNRQGTLTERASGDVQTALLMALIGDEARVVYDPAAGAGEFLRAVWNRLPEGRKPRLFGQELSAPTSRIARQRFLIEGIPASMAVGDSIKEDAWPDLRFDLVVADPPYGIKFDWPADLPGEKLWDRQWPPRFADFAWLLHCAHHLEKDGRAYVFLPLASLFREGAEADMRRRLLERGLVEAVVILPSHSTLRTALPIALWILRPSEAGGDFGSVLLMDAGAAKTGTTGSDRSYVDRLAKVLKDWRREAQVPEAKREFAAAVDVSDLIRQGATLVPTRWIHRELTPAQREGQEGELRETLRMAQAAREELPTFAEWPRILPSAGEWVPLKDLAAQGVVQFVKGMTVKPEGQADDGIPLLQARDLAARSWDRLACVYADPAMLDRPPELTKPGDIVLSPGSGALRVMVDEEGGHILQRPLQALRIRDGFIHPVVAAAFLESARNHRFVTGSAYARVSLRDLELPLLDMEKADALRAAFEELREQERLAGRLFAAGERARQLLVSLGSPLAEKEGAEDE